MAGQMRQSVFTDPALTLFQSAINDKFSQVETNPILSGTLIPGIVIAAGNPKSVSHGLGRVPVGVIAVSNTGSGAVITNNALSDTKTLVLNSTVTTTVSIWVF